MDKVEELLRDFTAEITGSREWVTDLAALPAAQPILGGDPATRLAAAFGIIEHLCAGLERPAAMAVQRDSTHLRRLLDLLLERPLDFSGEQMAQITGSLPRFLAAGARGELALTFGYVGNSILRNLLAWCHDRGIPAELRPRLEAVHRLIDREEAGDTRKLASQWNELLIGELPAPLIPMKPWGRDAAAWLDAQEEPAKSRWTALLHHSRTAYLSEPSETWLAKARQLVRAIGAEAFMQVVRGWFHLGCGDRTKPLADRNSIALRGLAWCAGAADCRSLAGDLSELVEAGYAKPKKCPIRSGKLGEAGLVALGLLGGPEAVAQITRLRRRVKHPAAVAGMDRALRAAAAGAADPGELEETAVPDYGLDLNGELLQTLGAHTATIRFSPAGKPEWRWEDAAGKALKSVPAAVKRDHPDAVEDLKVTARDLEDLIPAQAARIERLFLAPREWALPVWKERYLNHPLVARAARRLIWRFASEGGAGTGIWGGDGLVDSAGYALALPDTARVTLWHPLGQPVEAVLAWRVHVEERGIIQPFKQAHREVYLLTDAERQTANYSNRFAAHLLRHYQFSALCAQRGWTYRLPRFQDDASRAAFNLPNGEGKAEFWVEPAGDEMSEGGVSNLAGTGQVRLYAPDGGLRRLEEVPTLVFSEVMRDVDLFVGVCSVGNDPEWAEGRGTRHTAYWHRYSFGELTAAAETRRDVLGRLLPRLKIADCCSLAGRFLRVQGRLRAYKIHLGSGNVLMEANDQYLCIVESRNAPEGIHLPFEGDRTLSLILSKALLLADDDHIADPTIAGQICRA